MKKVQLDDVTLLGIDCVDIDRLILAAKICQQNFEFAEVKMLTSLPSKNYKHIVTINPITSLEEYSKFMISELDNYVTTGYVLVIQYDGFILNPAAWTGEFLNYDYIGAPWLVAKWAIQQSHFPQEMLGTWVVGNGGFSLRSKKLTSLCAQFSKQRLFDSYHPEDVAICVKKRGELKNKGARFAPVDLAKRFSYEAEDDDHNAWDGQFGFHGLSWTDISKWTEDHPEYKISNPAARNKSNLI